MKRGRKMAKYDENQIQVLEGLEAVRKRPGMYIGSISSRGLHHLVYEIVDNAVDEALAGFCTEINVEILPDNIISVKDNGRGIPVGKHPKMGISTLEVVFTVLHAGGKFGGGGYKVSGGLHGVGASVVNALSKWMDVTIFTDGLISNIKFKDGGEVAQPLKKIGESRKTGTVVTFMPDYDIFKGCNFSYTDICERMKESAFLIPELTVSIENAIDGKKEVYHFEEGLKSFVEDLNANKKPIHDIVDIHGSKNRIEVDVALQYTESYNEMVVSFVNNVKTGDGGSHVTGFKSAVTKVFNEYARNNGILKAKESDFDGDDVREGLTAVVSLKIPEDLLQFEGQTKGKLGTPQARTAVDSVISEQLQYFLEENKAVASIIMDKMIKSKSVREAARKARDEARNGKNKNKIEKNLSGKLAPAQAKNPKLNELFLVEGDSAGGSAKGGRDRKFQAILPLRGKVINTAKASMEEILKNEEINTMIHTIGAGVGSDFNVLESNYDKVIIMTDADVDGAHIRVLLLTLFYRFFRPIVEAGHVYAAQPPLFCIKHGQTIKYVLNEKERDEYLATLKPETKRDILRMKGLGEMDAEELNETTMDIEKRVLRQITLDDTRAADEVFSKLMGDEVEPRRTFIEENATFANLDA
jgi:topoisomerase-4 subunit B